MLNKYSVAITTICTSIILNSISTLAVYDPEKDNSTSTGIKVKPSTPKTETEEESLKRTIKEQEEQIRLLELKNKIQENQRLLEELEKQKSAPVVTPNAPVVTEHPEKAAEIKRIRENLSNKSERETDTLGRGLQKLDNHYDRKTQKKRNKWFWGIRKKDSHIIKLYNQGQLDMTSPPKKQ